MGIAADDGRLLDGGGDHWRLLLSDLLLLQLLLDFRLLELLVLALPALPADVLFLLLRRAGHDRRLAAAYVVAALQVPKIILVVAWVVSF